MVPPGHGYRSRLDVAAPMPITLECRSASQPGGSLRFAQLGVGQLAYRLTHPAPFPGGIDQSQVRPLGSGQERT